MPKKLPNFYPEKGRLSGDYVISTNKKFEELKKLAGLNFQTPLTLFSKKN